MTNPRSEHTGSIGRFLLIGLAVMALAACGGEKTRKNEAGPSTPSAVTPPPVQQPQPEPEPEPEREPERDLPPPENNAPTISGTSVGTINVGANYSFRPTANDADGDSLTFSIENKPSWAEFNSRTGRLSGTPTAADVGVYHNIVITVSDGLDSASLPAFSLTVNQISLGSATVSWMPPTQNTDGSALTNLAGYRIVYGTSSSKLDQTVQISNPGVSTYVVENLSPGTWYFAVKAYASNGVESDLSNLASKTIL